MPSLWNREIEDYKVDIFQASTLNYDRSLRLKLKATTSSSAHTVSIEFPVSIPSDFINIGSSFSTIKIGKTRFDEIYHILQTESPVFLQHMSLAQLSLPGLQQTPRQQEKALRIPMQILDPFI